MASFSTPRGDQTHRRILDATLQVIALEGVRAVTHRRVAAEAQSPSPGLITYYFASVPDLIAAAFVDVAEQETAALKHLTDQVNEIGHDIPCLVDLLTAEAVSRTAERKTQTTAMLALMVEMAGHEIDRDQFLEWEDSTFALGRAILEALGNESTMELSFIVSAMLDGLFMTAVINPNPETWSAGVREGLTQFLTKFQVRSSETQESPL